MLIFKENCLDVETYLYLRNKVNWKKLSETQAKKAIEGSLYTLVVYDNDNPIGMGRIVGDGAVISYIQDLIVIPEAQKNGVGGKLIDRLIEFVNSITFDDTEMMLCLMCAKGRENFYSHHNFIARPTDNLGPGMIQYIHKGTTKNG